VSQRKKENEGRKTKVRNEGDNNSKGKVIIKSERAEEGEENYFNN
jgi:hypothetical protein